MKKIIPSFLLTSLVSSSFLLAQGNARRVESTTNYELPTTNCNNQGHGLDCYMTMDPAELKNIEEGIESLRGISGSSGELVASSRVDVNTAEVQGASEVEDASVQSGGRHAYENSLKYQALRTYCKHWLVGIGATQEGSAYADKARECRVDPRLIESFNVCCQEAKISLDSGGFLALSWIQTAEDLQIAIEDSMFHIAQGESLLQRLSRPSTLTTLATSQLVKCKVKLIDFLVLRQRSEVMNEWEKIVTRLQRFIENYRRAEVVENNLNRYHRQKYEELLKKIAYSLKYATIADREEKHSLAALWLNLTHGNQLFLEHCQKLTFIKDEAYDLDGVSRKYLESIETMERMLDRAMMADHRGRQEEVVLYEKAAFQCQGAMESYRKIAESDQQKPIDDLLLADKAGKSFRDCAGCLQLAAEALKKAYWLEKNNNRQLSKFSSKSQGGDTAQNDGGEQLSNQEQVLLWRKAAEQYQLAAECERQATEAYTQGNIADGDSFHEEAIQISKMANKTIEVVKDNDESLSMTMTSMHSKVGAGRY